MGAFFVSNIESLYPHNKKVFLEAMENLKTHKKLGIVQATGTGKGKLASCFVEDKLEEKPDAKILILAPLNSILQNYREAFGLSTDIATYETYQKLPFLDNDFLFSLGLDYDLIIVDEFHRLGATKWFQCIKRIFEGVDNPKSTCTVIGFTATPIRYLDNARDMGVELFEGNIIQGVNLEDAICEGILPGFVYNACYFDTEDALGEVEKKLASNDYNIVDDTIRNDLMVKVRELKMLYHNKLKIENILKENTKDLGVNQKWIIFCRDKESLAEIRKVCGTWFISKPKMYIVHSDKTLEDNSRILKEFRNAKSGVNVMLCIDMLNEGVHIKDISGIIMLRKTDSPIIFLQQLGRALEAGKTTQPLIFDLIGNYKGLKIEEGGFARNPLAIVRDIEEKTKKVNKTNYVIVHNYTEALDKVMEELSAFLPGAVWTPEEDEVLKKYYPIGGYNLCHENGLSHRSTSSIVGRAFILGIKSFSKAWSDENLNILRKYFSVGGAELCKEKGLVGYSDEAIKAMANKLGFKSPLTWSDDDIDILRRYFPMGGIDLCKQKGLSNRTDSAIKSKADRLGLISHVDKSWNSEEDAILKKYYSIGGCELCIEKGLCRTKTAIMSRASKLGISFGVQWSDEELNILKLYYPQGGTKLCIEKGITKSINSIGYQARLLGLRRKSGDWTQDELDIMSQYYSIGGPDLVIKKGIIDRSRSAIIAQAMKMNLKVIAGWSDAEIEILKQYYPLGGCELCMKKGLGHKTQSQISGKAKYLGIKSGMRSGSWTSEELNILRTYYPVGGVALCQENGLSNKSVSAIIGKASVLGIYSGVKTGVKIWSDEELAILHKYYLSGGADACIKAGLNRDKKNIQKKASDIGLSKKPSKSWSEDEIEILRMYYPSFGQKGCYDRGLQHRTLEAIKRKALSLGLSKGR